MTVYILAQLHELRRTSLKCTASTPAAWCTFFGTKKKPKIYELLNYRKRLPQFHVHVNYRIEEALCRTANSNVFLLNSTS